ncbi:GntR family transcriptional regulator [Albidovulum sediminicola]|uniref:GntR family transcriptional regulator n=1 Tax=Albidovulum sediminicola TaxID=2984331 RepID=A0ABT2Z3D6_9RHOB|nr:GntR family transcriptional regulator [Defluviimonas sp. WL0075]MCV2865626.1 GntR family transcriptional regulator [Defluviimonas sp. WL0075]
MNADFHKPPTHELVYRKIREMILFGELAPGQAVTIQGLVSDLNAGMTPVREAIRRLTAEGALQFQGNRRVCVPELTLAQLDELAFARQAIEPQLAYLAAQKITPEAISKLESIDESLNTAVRRGDVKAYLEHNHRFHTTLYEQADASILFAIAQMLLLRGGPSLRVVCGRLGTNGLPDKHQQALLALRSGSPEAVATAIRDDVNQGIDQIRMTLSSLDV